MAIDKSDYRRVFATSLTHVEELLPNAKHHPDALSQYLKSWQEIAEKAAELDNPALQDVVSLFADAADFAFTTNSDNLSETQFQFLKQWNTAFANYVNEPNNQELVLDLVQSLNHPLLAMELSSDDIRVLSDSFLPIIQQISSDSNQDAVAPKNLEEQQLSAWEKLAFLLAQTDSILQDLLQQNAEQQSPETVQHYLESWKVVAEFIASEQDESLAKILDVILLLIEFSYQLLKQTERLSAEQQGLLKQWHHLFSSYIKVKGSQQLAVALIKLLTRPAWLEPLSDDDEKMLLTELQSQTISATEPDDDEELFIESDDNQDDFSEIAADITESDSVEFEDTSSVIAVVGEEAGTAATLQADDTLDAKTLVEEIVTEEISTTLQPAATKDTSIWQQLELSFNETVPHLKTAVDEQLRNDELALKASLRRYLEKWLILAQRLNASEEQTGLLDLVLSYIEVSRQTFEYLDGFDKRHITLLNKWQSLFGSYLKAKGNKQLAFSLIKCLSDPLWHGSLDSTDEELLLAGFSTTSSQPKSAESPVVETATTKVEETMIVDEVVNDEVIALEQPSEIEAIEVEYNSTVNEDGETTSVAQDEEDSIWEIIQPEFDQTAEFLQTAANPENIKDAAAFELGLQNYTTHWEAIVDIVSEDESLSGLIDVVSIFVEACRQTFAQSNSLNNEQLALLNNWQTNFADFFKSDERDKFAIALVKCLESRLWAEPVETEDELMLLEPFGITEIASEKPVDSENEGQDSGVLTTTTAEESTPEFESAQLSPAIGTEEFSISEESEADLATDEFSISADTATQAAPVNPELIGMVRDEFNLLVKEFNLEIDAVADANSFKDVLKNHVFKLENLGKACNTIGLLGLEKVFAALSFNMRSRRGADAFSDGEAELFKAALPLIQNHLEAITQRDRVVALVEHLSAEGWKQPLTQDQAQPLIELLSGLVLGTSGQQLDNRKTQAELDDVSLELPEDVNSELLDSLLNELPVLTNNFSAVIQQIISDDRDLPQLLEAQRIAHTLKGSGNIVGVTGIAVLTHHLEEILEYLSKHSRFPTKDLGKALLESADCLEMMSELMLGGESEPPEQALQVLQNVLDWATQIATAGLPDDDGEFETTTLPAQPDADITPVVKEVKTIEAIAMTRVPSEKIDQLLRMTGEGNILNEQFKERIKRFSDELKVLNDLTWHMQSLVAELDQAINIQSYSSKSSRSGIDSEFDALEMEQYNELHTAASRISEAATDIRETNIHMDQQLVDLKYLMIEEDAIQKENQEMIQSIRMVPASSISSRCQRIVRQACRATNKEVDLEIKGADILIDSEILNDMVDPLMHLLRNSIDHGIEPLHIREKFNKPKTGKITLEFSRKGNYAVITCKDDGGGLASGNILQTAIKKGLITAQQQLTEAEIHKLILIPGFSTRAVVTQTSGRGIGMDAIQTKVSSIQGQMSLFSARNEGLTIEITVPLTLSSMLSLLIKCGGQTMAISNRGLRKIHHADECNVVTENGQLFCDIDYQRYPGKHFSELVGIPITYSPDQKFQSLRIEDEIGRTHIVFVEELLGYRDLLVKNMGDYIPHIQGITGASILGNGDVAPVIDLVEMLHNAAKYDYIIADASKALADSINGLPVALVVDDSLSARRAVAMLLKDSGLEVNTAIDGLDAIKQIEKTVPDIILVDLEMPRMNGIELTAHVRNRDDMKEVPIIMITSRATEKHRKQAEAAGVTKFMTKPFTEDDLINSVRTLMP